MRTQTFVNGELGFNVRTKLNSLAVWDSTYSYNLNDTTNYNGLLYASNIDNNIGNIPAISTLWKNLIVSSSYIAISSSYATTSSYATNALGILNVKSFGAKGDGITDDTIAIQNTIITAGSGSIVHFPVGIYKATNNISVGRFQKLQGAGPYINDSGSGATIQFTGGTGITHNYSDDLFDACSIQDLSIYGDGTGTGVSFIHSHEILMERVRIANFSTGLFFSQSWDGTFINVHVSNCNTQGVFMSDLATDLVFIHGQFSNNSGSGFVTKGSGSVQLLKLYGCSIQYNQLGGVILDGIKDVFINNCHFEGNIAGDIKIGQLSQCYNVHLLANHYEWSDNQWNYFGGLSQYPYQILVDKCEHLKSDDYHYDGSVNHRRKSAFYVTSNASNVSILGRAEIVDFLAISEIRLTQTNFEKNLILNPLFNRDEANPSNYPNDWVTNDVISPTAISYDLPYIHGHVFETILEPTKSLYPIAPIHLELDKYTFSSWVKNPATASIVIAAFDNSTNTDTNLSFLSTGSFLQYVCHYQCDSAFNPNKTVPWIKFENTNLTSSTTMSLGEVCLAKGHGVPAANEYDAYKVDGRINYYSSQMPQQGTHIKRQLIWNDLSVSKSVAGWICTDGGTWGTLTGVTAWITSSNYIAGVNSASLLNVGDYIDISGSGVTMQVLGINLISSSIQVDKFAITPGTGSVSYHHPTFIGLAPTTLTDGFIPGSIPFADNTGSLIQSSNNLYWDNVNKRLGIGTILPQYSEHIYSTTGYDGLAIDGTSAPCLTMLNNGTVKVFMGVATSAGLLFSDSTTNDLCIRSQNNKILLGGTGTIPSTLSVTDTKVGVGTSLPQALLHVQGNISCSNVLGTVSTASYALSASYIGSGTNNYLPKWNNNVLTPTSSIYDNGINVAIGTGSAIQKLYVYSTTGYDGVAIDGTQAPSLQILNSGTIKSYISIATTAGLLFSNSTTNDLCVRSENNKILFGGTGTISSSMAITDTKVGIGLTSPTNKLDVVGNISCSVITASLYTSTLTPLSIANNSIKISGSYLYMYSASVWRQLTFSGNTLVGV